MSESSQLFADPGGPCRVDKSQAQEDAVAWQQTPTVPSLHAENHSWMLRIQEGQSNSRFLTVNDDQLISASSHQPTATKDKMEAQRWG